MAGSLRRVACPARRLHLDLHDPAVVDDPQLSPEVAAAAAAEIEAAELGDAATAGTDAPGGEAAPDPK